MPSDRLLTLPWLAAAYFGCQAAAVAAWWLVLWRWPATRAAFQPAGHPEEALLAFALPDAVVLAGGSMAVAIAAVRRSAWAPAFAWLAAGGAGYAFLYCLAGSLAAGGGWWAVAAMAPAAFASSVLAAALQSRDAPPFRVARPAKPAWNVAKTLAQSAVIWGLSLGLVPWMIAGLERRLGATGFDFPGRVPVAAGLFLALSAWGVANGIVMATAGSGTPLPFDCARRLVVAGPYAHVRNPMAIAGLGQGLAVGLGLGSWGVVAYVLLGGLAWNVLARPLEEADLERRFGDDYRRYRAAVRCWWPRRRAYRPGE